MSIHTEPTLRRTAPRYLQLDTWQLDSILASTVADGIASALDKLLPASSAITGSALLPSIQFRPETTLLSNLAVFALPALLRIPTAGQRVTCLEYSLPASASTSSAFLQSSASAQRARTLSVAIALTSQFCYEKLHAIVRRDGWDEMHPREPKRQVAIVLETINMCWNIIKLVSSLGFLLRSDHATVADRLLGLRLVPSSTTSSSSSSALLSMRPQLFNIIAFQVLTSASSELVQSVRDIADWSEVTAYAGRVLKRNARRATRQMSLFLTILKRNLEAVVWRSRRSRRSHPPEFSPSSTPPNPTESNTTATNVTASPLSEVLHQEAESTSPSSTTAPNSTSANNQTTTPSQAHPYHLPRNFVSLLPHIPCSHCGAAQAVNPLQSGCGHVFCYFCLHGALLVDRAFDCPECGASITEVNVASLEL